MFSPKKNDDESVGGIPSLSRKEAFILEMLVNSGRELYGLEMVEASDGALKRGTIYVTLQRMQEKDLIGSKQEPRSAPEIGIPRRLYWITGHGARVLAAHQAASLAFNTEPISIGD